MHRKGCRGSGRTGRAPEPLPCTKAVGNSLAMGGCGGADGKGCSVVPLLQGDIHKKGRSCPCLSFPPGKGELNYLMQRGTES